MVPLTNTKRPSSPGQPQPKPQTPPPPPAQPHHRFQSLRPPQAPPPGRGQASSPSLPRSADSDPFTRVQIQLLGETLHVRGAAPAAQIEQLAQEVDHRLQEAFARYPGEPRLRVLLLVCLNLAEELTESQQETAQYKQMLEELTRPLVSPPPTAPAHS